MDKNKQIEQLKQKVHNLKEQLKYSIPKRRFRIVFKEFITKIEKDGESMAGQEIKTAIEKKGELYFG